MIALAIAGILAAWTAIGFVVAVIIGKAIKEADRAAEAHARQVCDMPVEPRDVGPMTGILRRVATAAGVGALVAEWISDSLRHLDDLIGEFVTDVPATVPCEWIDDHL